MSRKEGKQPLVPQLLNFVLILPPLSDTLVDRWGDNDNHCCCIIWRPVTAACYCTPAKQTSD